LQILQQIQQLQQQQNLNNLLTQSPTPQPTVVQPVTLQPTPTVPTQSVAKPKTQPPTKPNELDDILKRINPNLKKSIDDVVQKENILTFETSIDPNIRPPELVSLLYNLSKVQCTQCGIRFKDRESMQPHLDWHFRSNQREREKAKKAFSRSWFPTLSLWSSETPDPVIDAEDQENIGNNESILVSVVVAREEQPSCPVCGEEFNQIWDADLEEWFCTNAILNDADEMIYHEKCISHQSDMQSEPRTPEHVELSLFVVPEQDDDAVIIEPPKKKFKPNEVIHIQEEDLG